ncbi:hypothetical protein LBMAG42_49370 [Deltaproteobacteria bacterium]|nr:hypothetical protein LBMAG42_49370 [Deltaproteobacteria bacterium]
MLILFSALLSHAFAADLPLPDAGTRAPSTGYAGTFFLPDARHREPGELEVAAGVGAALYEVTEMCLQSSSGPNNGCGGTSFDPAAMPTLRGAWTPGGDLRLEANAGLLLDGGAALDVSLSWSGAVSKVVRLGAFAGVAGSTFADFTNADGVIAGGGMLSARWERVALDVSVPVFAINDPEEEVPFYLPLALSEGSVSFALGKGHSLRVGMASLAPGVGWQYDGGHLLARADVHSLGMISVGRAEVGARF